MQGIFDRGDTNKDGVLTADEIRTMARAQAAAARGRGGEREGGREGGGEGGRGRGGPEGMMRMMDLIFAALDTNHDNQIDAQEIEGAAAALRTLDKNQDGKITPGRSSSQLRPGTRYSTTALVEHKLQTLGKLRHENLVYDRYQPACP